MNGCLAGQRGQHVEGRLIIFLTDTYGEKEFTHTQMRTFHTTTNALRAREKQTENTRKDNTHGLYKIHGIWEPPHRHHYRLSFCDWIGHDGTGTALFVTRPRGWWNFLQLEFLSTHTHTLARIFLKWLFSIHLKKGAFNEKPWNAHIFSTHTKRKDDNNITYPLSRQVCTAVCLAFLCPFR